MPVFVLQKDVHKNVLALRKALGSVVDPLSQAKLAALVDAKHPTRKVSASQVQRWEDDVEPDYASARILATLAGVSFESFALGKSVAKADDIGTFHGSPIDAPAETQRKRGRG